MNLWLIRHAKSSWANIDQADFDRPLNDRGVRDGKRMIRWMRAQQRQPARIISSDAVRARATTEFVQKGFGVPTDQVLFEHRIYEASIGTLLTIVHEIPDSCPSAALVGHNPGMSDFVNALISGDGDRTVIEDLPTFGVAMLALSPRWVDAQWGCAKLVMLHTPKTLRD